MSISSPGGTTVYLRQNGSNIQQSTDRINWTTITFSSGATVTNSSTTAGRLIIEFTTDITITNTGTYFKCNSNNIQFGSSSLLENGMKRNIIVDGVTDYPGFIQNGTPSTAGKNNIYIYNLKISSVNSSTLEDWQGWVGQRYFGKGATGNFIVNCSSNGNIPTIGGGIVGEAAGYEGGVLVIRGCSSTGSIASYGGGIAGHYSGGGADASVTCEDCWSEGQIGLEAGGIFGDYAAINNGTATARNCYSTGSIGQNAGGIYGFKAAENSGVAQAEKCYSRGSIGTNAGGIYGAEAGSVSGVTNATNCYSSGSIATAGNGIYGSSKVNGTEITCYSANSSWTNNTANSSLSGGPSGTNPGSVWAYTGLDQPYELVDFGYSPYARNNIDSDSQLVQTFRQTLEAGYGSAEAVYIDSDPSLNNFTILLKAGGNQNSYDTITMNAQTGSINTSSATATGTYTITVRSIGSYRITTFLLTIIQPLSQGGEISCCDRPVFLTGIDYEIRTNIVAGNILIGNSSARRSAISYDDIIKMKMAYAAKV